MPSCTNLGAGIPSSKLKYSRLSTDDGYIGLQEKLATEANRLWGISFFPDVMRSNLLKFKKSPPNVPYKATALATVQFLIGSILIIIGSLLLAGYISKAGGRPAIPVLIIGILVFMLGFYHLHIAYCASKGYWDYSYDIPDFDD